LFKKKQFFPDLNTAGTDQQLCALHLGLELTTLRATTWKT